MGPREESWPSEVVSRGWGAACQSQKQTTHRSLTAVSCGSPALRGQGHPGPLRTSVVPILRWNHADFSGGAPGHPGGGGCLGSSHWGRAGRPFSRALALCPHARLPQARARLCRSEPASPHPAQPPPLSSRAVLRGEGPRRQAFHMTSWRSWGPPLCPALAKPPSSCLSSTPKSVALWTCVWTGPRGGVEARLLLARSPRPACCLCPGPRPAFTALCPQGGRGGRGVGPNRCSLSA